MVKGRTRLILMFLLILLAGCTGDQEKGKQADLDRLKDRLRSLPYVGYSRTPSEGGSGIVSNDRELSFPGYNLYVTRNLSLAELLDGQGNVVRSWRDSTFNFWQDFELLPDGTFLVLGQKKTAGNAPDEDPFANRALLKLSWQGEKLEEIPLQAHHEIHFSPGKPLLTLLFDMRDIPEVNRKTPVLDNRIAALSPHGRVLDNISLYDLLQDTPGFERVRVKETKTRNSRFIDLFHTNTIEWTGLVAGSPLYSADNIIITMRHQDAIAIIDWKRKQVQWSWGQGELSGPHDATVLANGNVLVFDNGLGRGWSRVVEVDPLTREIVWEYRDPEPGNFYTNTRGTCQRFPNGNTLITESNRGRVFEVLPSGRIVWAFHSPHRDAKGHRANIIRMRRYSLDYLENIPGFAAGEG